MSDTARVVGFAGVGAMGAETIEALLDAGRPLAVYDARPEAIGPALSRGATGCASVAEVADAASVVLVSLPSAEAVRSVGCGENRLIAGRAMRTFVDVSTTGALVAEEIAVTHAAAGMGSGGAGARARALAVFAAGRADVYARVRPLIETFGKQLFHVGDTPGQVQNTATSDKFPRQVITRRFDAGFRLALMAKDAELCLAEAKRHRVPMLVGGLVQQLWPLAAGVSEESADRTEIARPFETWSGVEIVSSGGAADAGG